MLFRVRYGSLNGCGEWEEVEGSNRREAEQYAYELAVDDYDSYGEMHGLFNYEDFMEENPDATDEDATMARDEDIESYVEYEVEEA